MAPTRGIRLAIAVLLSAYVVVNGVLWIPNLALVRLGLAPFLFPAHPSAFLEVLVRLPWAIFSLWPVAVVLLAIAALRLFLGRSAGHVFAAGAVIDVAFLIIIKLKGAVAGSVFGVDPDYAIGAMIVVLAAVTWRTDAATSLR